MPIVALTHPVELPIAQMRSSLGEAFPAWQWRCSDDDSGGSNDRAGFERPQTIMGRRGDEIIIVTVEERRAPLPLEAGAPPHQLHLFVSQPSTDSPEIAKRIAVLICASLAVGDAAAHCQVAPEGRWYTTDEMQRGAAYCKLTGAAQGSIDSFLLSAGRSQPSAAPAGAGSASPLQPHGLPPGSPAERMALAGVDQSFAQILTELGGADFAKGMGFAPPPFYAEEYSRIDRLPTMVLALEHPIAFDWSPLQDLGGFDPGGNWIVEGNPDGSGRLRGRGCTVEILAHSDPVPRYLIENALARSFWFKDGSAAFARQSASLTITCDLDTRVAPFEDVRETAKVMTIAIGLLARSPGVIALLNAAVGTLLDVPLVQSQVAVLHKNEIPLMMWTWVAPDSLVENSVSMTTGGLLPFLGYEVEVWNAPGTADWVGDKLGKILNYLLHVGPVVNDGDPFGETPGERSIRGFFETTRAQRADKQTKVLVLEFDCPAGATPRPDAIPSAEPAPRKGGPDLVSLVALTTPTVFPSNILRDMLSRAFPDMHWTVRAGEGGEPHQVSGSGREGTVEAAIAAFGLTIPADLLPPPHRLHIAVYIGTHGDMPLARRVSLVLCSCLIISLDENAYFRVSADGNWLSHDDALTAVSLPGHTKNVGDFDQVFGTPPGAFRGSIMPSDAFPPAPDSSFDTFRSIAACSGPQTGAGLRKALSGEGPKRDAPAAQPSPGPAPGFGRRPAGFGRRGT